MGGRQKRRLVQLCHPFSRLSPDTGSGFYHDVDEERFAGRRGIVPRNQSATSPSYFAYASARLSLRREEMRERIPASSRAPTEGETVSVCEPAAPRVAPPRRPHRISFDQYFNERIIEINGSLARTHTPRALSDLAPISNQTARSDSRLVSSLFV